jgi:hypothetical protein
LLFLLFLISHSCKQLKCSYSSPVSPMILVLGSVLMTFGREKDFKTKKPISCSYLLLLSRSTPDTSSRSFQNLSDHLPPVVNLPASSLPSSSSVSPHSRLSGSLPALPAGASSAPGSSTSSPRSARLSSVSSNSNSNSEPVLTARSNDSSAMQNPILGLVHAGKRELTRKCELDNNLAFGKLIHALVKYPDRQDDRDAYIGTMPMWSSAREARKERDEIERKD